MGEMMKQNHEIATTILTGAEPFFFEGGRTGVLVLHGFTGTTQSMRYLGEAFAKAGFTVFGPRLTGHGISPEAMEKSTQAEWLEDVEAGLATLKKECDRVFVVGLSMGGTLTLYLAQNHPESAGIIPINAAIYQPVFIEMYKILTRKGTRFIEGIGSDIKADNVSELAYAKTPVKSMGEILSLMSSVREELNKITVPALIFSSTVDHVVPPDNSQEIYRKISSKQKEIVMMENSYHVATLDNDKELIAERSIAFMKSLE